MASRPGLGSPAMIKQQRSLSVGQTIPNEVANVPSPNQQQPRVSKKSELKRGRQVDKHKGHLVPSRASSHSRMLSSSPASGVAQDQTKNVVHDRDGENRKDEHDEHDIDIEPANKENENGSANKNNKSKSAGGKLNRKRRLQRRHTVGGTKDFADLDFNPGAVDQEHGHQDALHDIHNVELIPSSGDHTQDDFVIPNVQMYHQSVMMNVDKSLGMWIRRQKMGTSSPDLSLIGRRLSLPDSVLANASSFVPFSPSATTSLLESQV